jgi:hypothetical protein
LDIRNILLKIENIFYGAIHLLTNCSRGGIRVETDEAEIKAAMLSQRVRDAGIRAENKPSNGPLRVQSKAKAEYSATRGHALVAGDMFVSRGVHRKTCESRWHRG